MASFTRALIIKTFVALIDEHPINKITVKNITDACGINRNTFYYHFTDIPALIEAIVAEMTEQIIHHGETASSLEECIIMGAQFIRDHKRATLHICTSANRDIYDRYLMEVCDHTVQRWLDAQYANRKVSERDRTIIRRSVCCSCYGLFTDWINHGLDNDYFNAVMRLCELRKDFPELMFQRAEESC